MDALLVLTLGLVVLLLLGAAALTFGEDSRGSIEDDHARGRAFTTGGLG